MNEFNIGAYKTVTSIAALILFTLMGIGYIYFVSYYYGYSGFNLEINQLKIIEAIVVIIFLTSMLCNYDKRNRASKVFLFILFVNVFLPVSVLYGFSNQEREFYYLITLFFLILLLFLSSTKQLKLPSISQSKRFVFSILIIITVSVYCYLILMGGISRINLNLLNVYDTRSGYTSNSIPIFNYLVPWQAHIINLFFLVYGYFKKNKFIIYISLILQLFLFSMTNFKSFLFAPLVVFAIMYFMNSKRKNKLLLLIFNSLNVALTILLIVYLFNKNITLLSIFLRRLFFVPAQLHFIYFEYFSVNEKFYLSHSIFEGLVSSSYQYNPVKTIAMEVFGEDFSPNVGVIGDAYTNFGVFGMILIPIILGLYLWVLDSITYNMNLAYSVSLVVIPAMSLVNSSLFTSLLTHGLLFSVFILWLTAKLFDNVKERE